LILIERISVAAVPMVDQSVIAQLVSSRDFVQENWIVLLEAQEEEETKLSALFWL
jgi:hypothetical protein